MFFISSSGQSAMYNLQGSCAEVHKISSRLLTFSKCIKRVFDVYFRCLEFHHAWTNQVKIFTASTTGGFYWQVGVFLRKRPFDYCLGKLSIFAAP